MYVVYAVAKGKLWLLIRVYMARSIVPPAFFWRSIGDHVQLSPTPTGDHLQLFCDYAELHAGSKIGRELRRLRHSRMGRDLGAHSKIGTPV